MVSREDAVAAGGEPGITGRESPPATFSQLGIPVGSNLRNTALFGPIKPFRSLSPLEWAFFAVSSLSLVVSLGFTIERLITLETDSDDYTFAIMLCFTSLFCFFYIVHGILKERYHEIGVFLVSTVLLTIYVIINVASAHAAQEKSTTLKWVRLVIAIVFLVAILYLGVRVVCCYRRDRKLLFLINAKEDLQAMLGWLFLCASLIFFDVQLQGTMLIFVMNNGTKMDDTEKIVLAVGVPVTIIWAVSGSRTIYKESKAWLFLFIVLWFPNVVYIGLRLYHLNKNEAETALYRATVACAIVALLIRVLLAINMAIVVRNFGHGIREKLETIGTNQEQPSDQAAPEDGV